MKRKKIVAHITIRFYPVNFLRHKIKKNLNEIGIAENPLEVVTRKLYRFEHDTFAHITLQQGESLKKHIIPVYVIFFGLGGAGKVEISNEI